MSVCWRVWDNVLLLFLGLWQLEPLAGRKRPNLCAGVALLLFLISSTVRVSETEVS